MDLERGAEVELLRVLAEEGPGRVQLDEVDVVAALLRHLLQHIQIFLEISKYFIDSAEIFYNYNILSVSEVRKTSVVKTLTD